MSFVAANFGRFIVHQDLFDHKTHAIETVRFLSLQPRGIVVYFMDSIYQTYLENRENILELVFPSDSSMLRNPGIRVNVQQLSFKVPLRVRNTANQKSKKSSMYPRVCYITCEKISPITQIERLYERFA